ncbi:glycoside hydrolase family 71 protein [Bradyrhizobium sp. 15]|uniref:glycoside hydrolase family 71 protein n=1 Tax=Bradyrhizobium sp. 15 TaxID=2782633 RepID=UPI001FFAEA30|nr:hypothetical protein [Bradyrhizobium sp. 15]
MFAHYMVCCPRLGLQSTSIDLEREILDARRLSIDGFALNIGSWKKEEKYIRIPGNMFEAAGKLGPDFKLFFSLDNLDVDESAEIVARFAGHPNYLRVDGKVVVSSYGGDPDWGRKLRAQLLAKHIEIFLVPFYYYGHLDPLASFDPLGKDAYIARRSLRDADDLDGYFYFGSAAAHPELAQRLLDIGKLTKSAGRLSMLGVSPFYKGFGPRNSRVFESHGFESMQSQWLSAINSDADWVELVTWNDWGEATYLAPFGHPTFQDLWRQHWGKLLAHDKFLEASQYYVTWFKERVEPRIVEDKVFYFYRIHPKTSLGFIQPEIGEVGRPTGSDSLDDEVYVTTYLSAPAELHFSLGQQNRTLYLPSGVSNIRFPVALGRASLSLHREGREIRAKDLEFEIVPDGRTGNFNYFGGSLD